MSKNKRYCEHKYCDGTDYYKTACGNYCILISAIGFYRQFKYCPYCGKLIKTI